MHVMSTLLSATRDVQSSLKTPNAVKERPLHRSKSSCDENLSNISARSLRTNARMADVMPPGKLNFLTQLLSAHAREDLYYATAFNSPSASESLQQLPRTTSSSLSNDPALMASMATISEVPNDNGKPPFEYSPVCSFSFTLRKKTHI